MGKLIKVTLLGSASGQKQDMKETLIGLALTKRHKTVCLPNDSAIRGMIRKVQHLVAVAAVAEEKCLKAKAQRQPSYRVLEEK